MTSEEDVNEEQEKPVVKQNKKKKKQNSLEDEAANDTATDKVWCVYLHRWGVWDLHWSRFEADGNIFKSGFAEL